jgi:hypothetical protein
MLDEEFMRGRMNGVAGFGRRRHLILIKASPLEPCNSFHD